MGLYEEMDRIGREAYNQGKEETKLEVLKIIARNSTIPNIIPDLSYYPLETIIKEIKEL